MNPPATSDAHRRLVAAEIVELGETLFDAILDAAAARSGAEESEPLPEAEFRRAAEEFFQTLRVLLEVTDPPVPESGTSRAQEVG
jgi:hypothetical protein